MALLLDIRDPNWMREEELRDLLAPLLPGVPIYCSLADADLEKVLTLAVVRLRPGVVGRLPALKLVQKLGAGVESIVHAPDLPPQVRVARLKPQQAGREIAEYCLAYVLRDQRNMLSHSADAKECRWSPIAPCQSHETSIGVLGLGHIGGQVAKSFAALGFRVLGWSRSPKIIEGVTCVSGGDALPTMLGECDYVVSILPSTPDTRDLFDSRLFAEMKTGARLINVGRGDLIVEEELLAALDSGPLAGAVLDVFRKEPLPAGHPFWQHDKITVTPHISGWHLDDGLQDVAENYRRLVVGEPLLHEVDRQAGY